MRILSIEYEPSSRRGGQEWSMLDECRGLVGLGHEVVLAFALEGDLLPDYATGGVETVHTQRFTMSDRSLRSAWEWAAALWKGLRQRPDVVLINQYHESLYGAVVARLAGVPLVSHLRLFPPAEFCGQWRVGVSNVTRFIAVSNAVKVAWSQRGCDPDAIDVVHDGVDLTRFRRHDSRAELRRALGVPQDAFVILYAGRLDRTKNLEELLHVFAALGLTADRARLLVAGRPVDHPSPEAGDAYVASLRALADRLGIGPAVHWLGSRPDVPELLSASDMAALFQLYPEPLARAAYESLACGTPIIAQRSGGMTEVLSGEFRWLTFDGSDRREVVELIHRVMSLPAVDPGFAERARRHAVEGFSKERMVAGVAASLERATATRPLHRGPKMARLRGRQDPVPVVQPAPALATR